MEITCAFCNKLASVLQVCPNCEKVWYCNDMHMEKHRSQHKGDCFPAEIQSEPGCGRYWVASRDISKGELIFSEPALVIGPNSECTPTSPLYPTCLGCCRTTNPSYVCSKCHWPVCSKACEKIPQHADYECKVLRKNRIPSSTRAEYYLYIQFLRGLLLKDVDPPAFHKMIELEPHTEPRKGHKDEAELAKSFYRFLIDECNISQHEFDFIDKIVGVNRINSYSADVLNTNSKKRCCTALFWQMSLINHDCLPNTRSVIFENPDLSLSLGLFASIDIWKGQCITQQYFPVVKGTMVRRKALKEWFFDCICKRCSDPTEFGTYFSCFRCNLCWKKDLKSSYLCPLNPLNETSAWTCNNRDCNHSMTHSDVERVTREVELEIQEATGCCVGSLESVLERIISDGNIHISHHIAINLQYEITEKIVRALNNERDVDVIRRGATYSRNILRVVDILCPGYSYYRGVILYFLGNCLYALFELGELPSCMVKELREILQEGIEIMEVEPKGSMYHDMTVEMENYLDSLRNSKI